MKKIKLKNFKAFESEIELKNPQAKNILLFGENGSGKSSIYEALRYVFYQEEIEKVDTLLPLPDQRAKIDSIRSNLTNQHSALPFSIELNGKSVGSFPKTDYQVFMLTRFDKSKSLGLALLLDNGNIPISDKEKFLSDNWEIIKDNVNVELRDCFLEPLSIEIGDERSRYPVTIINNDTGLSRVSDLDKYFNEAAINLVQLLIWFSAVQLAIDPAKKKLIVLDDFITSLDAANRAYMMRYVLKTFSEAQLIILTHDYSLFNITIFLIDHVLRTSNEWVQYKLYIIGTEHRLATAGKIEIKDLRNSLRCATNYDSIGNDVRKCFEQRLYDLAAELSIGRLETTKNIIECLGQGKNVYFKPRTNLSELVEAIETLLPTITDVRTRAVFQAKINEYKVSVRDATLMKDTVNLLKFYQKITMHPMSHGTLGIPHFCRKDVEESIKLLEQLDKCVTSILDGKV